MSRSIFEALASRGFEVKENNSNPDEFLMCCPFCVDMGTSPDFRFRFGFNIQSGLGHCFNCNYNTRKALLDIVRKLELDADTLTDVEGTFFTKQTRLPDKPVELPDGFQLLEEIDEDDEDFGEALRYCINRGITKKQLHKHEIGASISDWKYQHRILFPVRDRSGLLLGFFGRDWTDTQPLKYKNSLGTKSVWNARLDLYPKRLVILSEGAIKALAIERAIRYKFCSAATCGLDVTDAQLQQIKGFDELILFSDPDPAGMSGYLGVAAKLSAQFKKITLAWPWPEKQADELKPEQIRQYLRQRKIVEPGLRIKVKLEMPNR